MNILEEEVLKGISDILRKEYNERKIHCPRIFLPIFDRNFIHDAINIIEDYSNEIFKEEITSKDYKFLYVFEKAKKEVLKYFLLYLIENENIGEVKNENN